MPKHRHRRVYFTPQIGEVILRRIAEGEPLIRICGPSRAAGMPDRITVYEWLRKDEGFRQAYLVARQVQAELYAEQIMEIADGRPLDGEAGGEPSDVRRDWLRMSARRWMAGVMAPRTYGGARGGGFAGGAGAAAGGAGDGEAGLGGEDESVMAARIAAILEAARMRMIAESGGEGGGSEVRILDRSPTS